MLKTLGEVHRRLWDRIVERLEEGGMYAYGVKSHALTDMLDSYEIDWLTYQLLLDNKICVLCMAYRYMTYRYMSELDPERPEKCGKCPLARKSNYAYECRWYNELCKGKLAYARRIRDVELSEEFDSEGFFEELKEKGGKLWGIDVTNA